MTLPGAILGVSETCMTLPSLRKIEGKYIDSQFDRWPSGEKFPLESNVTDIIFHYSAINDESFARLLTRTRNLQRLTYGFIRLPSLLGDYTAMGLKNTLEQHTAHTLTHLDLKISGYDFNHHTRFIGSLRQLEVLKHLRIQGVMFVDYSSGLAYLHRLVDLLPLLPVSIETLTLLPQADVRTVTYTLNQLREKRNMKEIPRPCPFTLG